jgi:hypothetical protein
VEELESYADEEPKKDDLNESPSRSPSSEKEKGPKDVQQQLEAEDGHGYSNLWVRWTQVPDEKESITHQEIQESPYRSKNPGGGIEERFLEGRIPFRNALGGSDSTQGASRKGEEKRKDQAQPASHIPGHRLVLSQRVPAGRLSQKTSFRRRPHP